MRSLLVIIILAVLLPGCQSEPPRAGAGRGMLSELPAPGYHAPAVWWRANHGTMVDGPWDLRPGSKPTFQWQECALCHDLRQSCQACHRYLGLSGLGHIADQGDAEN